MLQAMRRNSRHAIIYVLFGILIAAFVISFGPGSRGFGYSGVSSAYAAKVAGSTVSEQDFHFAYVALGGTQYPPQVARERRLKEFVMDRLIERELFATEAAASRLRRLEQGGRGQITTGKMIVMGVPRRVDSYVYKDGKFDYDRFKMVSQNQLGVTVQHFIEIQKREMLADKVREALRVSSKVSPDEVKRSSSPRGLQVNLEYARFAERRYEDEIGDADAGRDRRLRQGARGRAQEAVRRARLPLQEPGEAGQAAPHRRRRAQGSAAGSDGDGAHQGAERARQDQGGRAVRRPSPRTSRPTIAPRVAAARWAGARRASPASATPSRRRSSTPKTGALVGPERTERGFELVEVEAFREGDVPLADAEKEMAADEVRKDKAKEKAKAEAQAIMDRVNKGEKLDAILTREVTESERDAPRRSKSSSS